MPVRPPALARAAPFAPSLRGAGAALATLLLPLVLTACGGGTGPTSLTIVGGDRALEVGATVDLDVAEEGADDVAWRSADPGVATVDGSGTVVAVAAGETVVTARPVGDRTGGGASVDASGDDAVSVSVHPVTRHTWTHQFGSDQADVARAVALAPDGTSWTAGHTDGAVGSADPGERDAFVRALDPDGQERWTRQFGTAGIDAAFGVAADGSGGVVVAGHTKAALGGPLEGTQDVFVRAFDAMGSELWTVQFGTTDLDAVSDVAVSPTGRIAVAGGTGGGLAGAPAGGFDAYVRVLDGDGTTLWTAQFGTTERDAVDAVTFDGEGDVLVAGSTRGPLRGPVSGDADVFVRRYDGAGDEEWTRQFGSPDSDTIGGIAAMSDGTAVVAGGTYGALAGGEGHRGRRDAFVRAFTAEGEVRWTRQLGTDDTDMADAVAAGARDRLVVAGDTRGDLDGRIGGLTDAFLVALDARGVEVRRRQFGTVEDDTAVAVAVDGAESARVAGTTRGGLDGDHAGRRDAFVRAYGP